MSVRQVQATPAHHVAQLQKELNDLKQASTATSQADGFAAQNAVADSGAPTFDDLTEVEKSAASLGVHPNAWKPISFLNTAHFGALLANNQLDSDLARRINAFSHVAKSSA